MGLAVVMALPQHMLSARGYGLFGYRHGIKIAHDAFRCERIMRLPNAQPGLVR